MALLTQEELLNRLDEDLSLLNSSVTYLQIEYLNDKLIAKIRLLINNFQDSKVLSLVFSGVKEYSFFYSNNHSFYNVENYKFYKSEIGVFLSLDPIDDSFEKSFGDQDYILAIEVQGVLE